MRGWTRWGRRAGILFPAIAFLAVAALCGAVPVSATVLTVDKSLGNSPYNVTTSLTYDNESVGISSQGGIMNQAANTNAVSVALNVGAQSGASGTYSLSGTGSLNVAITTVPAAWEYVGVSGGTGTFNQSGGTNNMPGGILFVGSDVLGSGKGGTGAYNLSGGLILSTRQGVGTNAGPGTGVEAIGDSGGNGTLNQTGGTNNCNNGVFVGSDTEWVYYKNAHTGATGVYNLSGADSVLITSGAVAGDARGGEVVGDGGGIGTFNQTGGTNNATWSGLAVGSDVYGSGYGGVGVFNLSGGCLAASPLPEAITHSQAVGGEIIGTTRGIGTLNQSGGTNEVQAGLFVGSDINYALQNNMRTGGTGVYNLSGGALTASGSGTPGASGYIPGEDIGDAGGTGTFTQTGGTNTLTQGLLVGTDVYQSGKGGTGVYNLGGPGSVGLNADLEAIGDGRGAGTFNQMGGTNTVNSGLFVGSDIEWSSGMPVGASATGIYNLSGAGSVLKTEAEIIGDGGSTGTFNQSGGTNIATDGGLAVGADIFGSGVGGIGTFNLSGGSLNAYASPNSVGGEVIGDSGGNGTFNQTGGTNTVDKGLFIGSDLTYSLYHIESTGGTGVYNLSGGVLTVGGSTTLDIPGEDIGDTGGTGTFNQTGGTQTVVGGMDIGGAALNTGIGGIGTYNLSGGSLTVSGVDIGESIGDTGGKGTFNQSGGTHTVVNGLFIGSFVNYYFYGKAALGAGGTGAYNLSGGSLTASGNGTLGAMGYIPGEDIGDAGGKGTFTQTGGTNTVTQGLLVGTDLYQSGNVGTGAYNLSGGSLQADFEWMGGSGAGTFTQSGGINWVSGEGAPYGIEMNGGTYHLNGGTLIANSFDGNLDNEGGTFLPTTAGSVFTGNYTQGKNSVLQIGIASSGSYTWLDMANTGKAT
ncbi:MAG: beta strand repeat-containing protein, partial [Syntrophobacteraceae bacterium]